MNVTLNGLFRSAFFSIVDRLRIQARKYFIASQLLQNSNSSIGDINSNVTKSGEELMFIRRS